MSINPIVIIPVRLGSTRLPQKPLALIEGKPMVEHVWRRACQADVGPVVVATDAMEIAQIIENLGGQTIMTDPELPSGSDRVFAALTQVDPKKNYNVVINLQGDLPNIDPAAIRASINPLHSNDVDVATLAAVIKDESELTNPNVVKIAMALDAASKGGKALYFSRSMIPHGPGPHYHHIGLYAYRREILERFVTLAPSSLELQERLEQLRLLELGVRFGVELVDQIPVSVDTPEDLERARAALKIAA